VNIIRTSFHIPGLAPSSWLKYFNDVEVQRSIDSKLDRYFVAENYKNNYIIYCSYRKMLMIEARDMLYFKTIKKIGECYMEACKSI